MKLKPYYNHAGITIYHGDARKILPHLSCDTIITDPVWPNCLTSLAGSEDPYGLFQSVAKFFPKVADRAVVVLGCTSDPRFLSSMPRSMPFLRACRLAYSIPSYRANFLIDADFAYVFGKSPRSKGYDRHLMPGNVVSRDNLRTAGRKNPFGHPCPRNLSHMRWLVRWYADEVVIDPFCGSGTSLVAAKEHRKKAIGIEIEEKYCAEAVKRLRQEMLPL